MKILHLRTCKLQTLRISGVTVLGPWDEKAAMKGAGFVLRLVFGREIYAIGVLKHN